MMPGCQLSLLGFTLVICFAGLARPGQAQEADAALTPLHGIPKLPMFDTPVDYKKTLMGGVLAPERIECGEATVRLRQSETDLTRALGTGYDVVEEERYRTREQQWEYLRALRTKNRDSMHYYILAHIYYDLQLSGWFKVHEWTLDDLKIRAYLVRATEKATPRIWLLHLLPDSVPEDRVAYVEAEELTLTREGVRRVRWNVGTNTVVIDRPLPADQHQ